MKLSKQTTQELKDSCLSHLKRTVTDMVSLQEQREKAFDAYLSKPYGYEVEGRSKFVTSDLADTVDSIMPSLMKTFYGSSNVVAIQPVGAEDEQASRLMEQKVNYDFTVGLNGYRVLETWFRDALYQKMGVVKYYWSEEKQEKFVEYDDMTEAEYINLLGKVDAGLFVIDKEEVETAQEAEFDEFGSTVRPAEVKYCVEGRKITKISKPMVENVPPEEFIFDIKSKNIAECEFAAHKKRVHKTYLTKYGLSEADLAYEVTSFATDQLYIARFQDLGGVGFLQDMNDPDFFYLYECYVPKYDKGKRTPMKMVIVGNQVVSTEVNKYGRPPFCTLTPITIPHRLVGRDYADMVMPIQELNTYYVRYVNDNLAFQNNGMRVVNPFRVQMDDVLNENNPGGIWRTKYDIDPSRVVMPLTPTPLAPEVYGMLERMDAMRQERTGVTKYQQGMDSKSLNRTAFGIAQIMGAAQQRVEMLARTFAETGVTDMFQALVDMNLDFFDAEVSIKINKGWQQITPDMIDGNFDITVDVSASFGSSEIRSQQMMLALNTYQMLKQGGTAIPEKYIYEILREWWTVQGYKNVDSYAPSPEQVPKDIVEQQKVMGEIQQAVGPQMPPQGQGPMPQGLPQ